MHSFVNMLHLCCILFTTCILFYNIFYVFFLFLLRDFEVCKCVGVTSHNKQTKNAKTAQNNNLYIKLCKWTFLFIVTACFLFLRLNIHSSLLASASGISIYFDRPFNVHFCKKKILLFFYFLRCIMLKTLPFSDFPHQ